MSEDREDTVSVDFSIDFTTEGRIKISLECDVDDIDIVAARTFTAEMQESIANSLDAKVAELQAEHPQLF